MINLITTDSYYNLFSILIKLLEQKGANINQKNLIFCEEKVSLMIERMLCYQMGGSFNTDVYSFGNFLRVKKPNVNALSKEGASMVVKKVLSTAKLNCFKASRQMLAPTLSELIMQLKSAKISHQELLKAKELTGGVLKNKLSDIAEVFSEYEKFLNERGLEDQSSSLSFLPELIENSEEIKKANVYLVGFSGFTAQQRSTISAIFDNATNVTAILTQGDNPLVFVNETANYIKALAKEKSLPIISKFEKSDYTEEGKFIVDTLFCGSREKSNEQTATIHSGKPLNAKKEVEKIAQIIKSKVINENKRYRDFTVAIPNQSVYSDLIKKAFSSLSIPFFLDERKKVENHPLVTLILSYLNVFYKNFERKAVCAFFKNPLFESDKTLTDAFENYLIKYNVNYSKIKQPFTLFEDGKEDITLLESFRQKVENALKEFNVRKMLDLTNAKEKIEGYSVVLDELGESEEGAVNNQVYGAVESVLNQMDALLGGVNMSVNEYKNVFLSGISAMEISIIPQYNDAVFVGDYKQTALAKADVLFAIGLTAEVPGVQADIALITDADIERLENVKLLIEPKIRVVNHRSRENVALALASYSNELYITCPAFNFDGQANGESEVFTHIAKAFKCLPLPEENEYLTYEQGEESFAKECGLFVENQSDFVGASSFYHSVDTSRLDRFLDLANKQVQVRLESKSTDIIGENVSPTTIEDYYKCPYRAFLSHKIKLKNREDGKVQAFSVGTLIHEIFSRYTKDIKSVTDKESSDALVESIYNQVVLSDEFKRFMADSITKVTIEKVLRESKKYCYNTYLYMKDCSLEVKKQEVSFGEGKYYPPVSLLDGKVKLRGKIDRVDTSDKYFRIIDYKTGKAEIADKNLYSGIKLQLYLYAASVGQKESDKQLAGLYYLPVSDKYEKEDEKQQALALGKTLDDENALSEQDINIKENKTSVFLPLIYGGKSVSNSLKADALNSYVDYAVKVSELGAKQMKDGVILPSASQGTCDYCEFKALCGQVKVYERSVGKVDEDTIFLATKGGVDNAELDD